MLAYVNMPKLPSKCLKIWENSRKSSKIAQKTRFYPKVVLQYFSNHCRYGSNIFGGSKHNPWVVFEAIMGCLTHPPLKPPSHLVNSCLFHHFYGSFDLQRAIGQQIVNTIMLTQISGHIDQTLELLHLKYYDHTMSRSIKNHFLRCLLAKVPFEIRAFISGFSCGTSSRHLL